MRVVAERVDSLRAALRDVVFVGLRRLDVRIDDVLEAADPLVDVRWHVDDVSRAWHQRQQAIGFGFRTLRRVGRFPQVNPQMQRAGMVPVLAEDVLQ